MTHAQVKKAMQEMRTRHHREIVELRDKCPHERAQVRRRGDGSGQADRTCTACGKLLSYGPARILEEEYDS
jgi:hypothetical protein